MEVQYMRFDWAMKRLLRQKSNFEVLEGLLSTLLEKDIYIKEILESESNKESAEAKANRVDVLAEDEHGDLFLIEVQNNSETSYFQRMIFGVSRLIVDYIKKGDNYDKIKKIYSINIVYFNLGISGNDYVYHGTTEFRGLHRPDDILSLSLFQMERFNVKEVSDIFPEYYILRVNGFNDVAKTPLEEWIAFLRDGSLPASPSAAGLRRAGEIMRIDTMTPDERAAYHRRMMDMHIIEDNVTTARIEGHAEGHAEGRAEGLVEGRAEGLAEGAREKALAIARNLKAIGMSTEQIIAATGLTAEDI